MSSKQGGADDATAFSDPEVVVPGEKKKGSLRRAGKGLMLVIGLVLMAYVVKGHLEQKWEQGLPKTFDHLCALAIEAETRRDADSSKREPSELALLAERPETLFDGVGQSLFLMRQSLTTGPVPWAICSPGVDDDELTSDDVCIGDWFGDQHFREMEEAPLPGDSNVRWLIPYNSEEKYNPRQWPTCSTL